MKLYKEPVKLITSRFGRTRRRLSQLRVRVPACLSITVSTGQRDGAHLVQLRQKLAFGVAAARSCACGWLCWLGIGDEAAWTAGRHRRRRRARPPLER